MYRSCPLPMSAVQDLLDAIPDVPRYQRFVTASVGDSGIVKFTRIDPLPKNPVQCGHGDLVPAFSKSQPLFVGLPRKCFERILARSEPLEQCRHHRSKDRIGHNNSLAILPHDVHVAWWCESRPHLLSSFRVQPFLHFLRQIVDVVLGHQHSNAMHELLPIVTICSGSRSPSQGGLPPPVHRS